jgi:hypothetical protein
MNFQKISVFKTDFFSFRFIYPFVKQQVFSTQQSISWLPLEQKMDFVQ